MGIRDVYCVSFGCGYIKDCEFCISCNLEYPRIYKECKRRTNEQVKQMQYAAENPKVGISFLKR